ncbi:probable LRR receptor-like serine/threonine-protein kinase At1g05700 [Phaseolus vulgaris]|uniref:probable LRR receptor-like serine/threonine-protein kinase At1g05700 n=1 Tax=Phaseolus vulgaris TaxID=3885 RepID=UPI0035CA0AFA
MVKHFVLLCLTLSALIHAQDQSEFISIDCGVVDEPSYKDETTGIEYSSDGNATDTGINRRISSEYMVKSLERRFWNVRSFPEGTRNCYTLYLPRMNSNKRVIRARFMYGNYDGKDSLPKFDLYLGPNFWDSVEFENASTVTTMEIVHVATSDYIQICLVNTDEGTPFISTLEIRVLNDGTYVSESIQLLERFDVGLQEGQIVRYPDDIYDRIWSPYNPHGWKQISTTLAVANGGPFSYGVPSTVLKTAATPENVTDNLGFSYQLSNGAVRFYVYMYFAEIEKLEADQTRQFDVFVNGALLQNNATLPFLGHGTLIYISSEPETVLQIWINRTNKATMSPILNGIELYQGKTLDLPQTHQNDVGAIMQIKSTYNMKQIWQGDPCSPKTEMWKGVNCSYNGHNQPRITSLNLSSSGLNGSIVEAISNLKLIQYLDLSNNNLTGSVPDSLSELEFLMILNIGDNKLSGSIPSKLSERTRNGSLLILIVGGNPHLCFSSPCPTRKKIVIPLVVTALAALILSATLSFVYRRRLQVVLNRHKLSCFNKTVSVDSKKQEFTYSEVRSITNNFERVVGKGGFGIVYHGCIGETQVAVKMLTASTQGYQQFQTEANILTRVHHKCLTPLIGYYNEGNRTALIYEYMTNGDLSDKLSGESQTFLDWKQRLQIALDAAVGLEYLHNGCKPPIVHRDVKTRNILLNENLRAKISDFGLSRIFSDEGDTHVSTVIAGTPGYLDPEYYITNRLNEKSDVFSFGVVLLEIITGRKAILKSSVKTHIIKWVSSILEDDGEIDGIMDPRLQGDYDSDAARKVVDVAMVCVAPSSVNRPSISQVAMELKLCFPIAELRSASSGSIEIASINEISGFSSLAR